MSARGKIERAIAVIGAVALIVMATDALTYAATGSSLILGKANSAGATTTLQNTATGGVPLKLLTKSTATAPLAVNGKGKVTNLYADRSATADNASKVGGQTLAQVKASVGVRPAGVIWVAPSGGNFTSVSAAMASITTNDATHPFVIEVAPGLYTESTVVVMKPYVTIEGAGENLTTIQCTCSNAAINDAAAVISIRGVVTHNTLSDLAIRNTAASGSYSIGVKMASVELNGVVVHHVTVSMTPGASTVTAFHLSDASPTLDHVTALATNDFGTSSMGIRIESSALLGEPSPSIDDSNIYASGGSESYGIFASDSGFTMRSSQLSGGDFSVVSVGAQTKTVMNSMLTGPASGSGLRCLSNLNAISGVALDAACA